MNLSDRVRGARRTLFRLGLAARALLPARRLEAFGKAPDRIDGILVINLDRQPSRWLRLGRELNRFRTYDGRPLVELVIRLPAVDARDGRSSAPTADVDPIYQMSDQLFVQPDARLRECFGPDEQIRMTRQEIAVARSHVEAWKRVANGSEEQVLILEDDVYFANGAATLIDRGWQASRGRKAPDVLYMSYHDAGGTLERTDVTCDLFRPVRGLWYLSGYVLSRQGAMRLLRSMPVVGPVDLWMNRRFSELDVLALARSALLQRSDGASDNSYSIVPYLARAGIVDAGSHRHPRIPPPGGPIFAWNASGPTDTLGMALSMLGFRVRSHDAASPVAILDDPVRSGPTFDAHVDLALDATGMADLARRHPTARFILACNGATEYGRPGGKAAHPEMPATSPILQLDIDLPNPWGALCAFLQVPEPNAPFPSGSEYSIGLFRADDVAWNESRWEGDRSMPHDVSPWIIPSVSDAPASQRRTSFGDWSFAPILRADLSVRSPSLHTLVETFPGNMATFDQNGLDHVHDGTSLTLVASPESIRPYRSGAFASNDLFRYGRFQADLMPARGPGLVTGFFLHRDEPRQEIDIEFLGRDTSRMLVNVFFNPGDGGTPFGYGYRGSPHVVDLGFDASKAFHAYAIEWTPDRIRWLVDGGVVHERTRWNPTPIPHLPMRLHANLWAPRSTELAGTLLGADLPARSTFKRILVESATRRALRDTALQPFDLEET